MNKLEKIAVLKRFEEIMRVRYGKIQKEVPFNKIMATKRRFRADYLIGRKTIVEINGGQWINGRHNRGGVGYERDLQKMNLAQRHGFRYFQFTYEMLKDIKNLDVI